MAGSGQVQMQRWGSGYVTDVEYTDGFYSAQAPHSLALAAAIDGFEPPDLTRPFTYCELGCGRGATSLVLAASHPHAEFHAVDFHPAHIAHAEARARAAALDNITFHERSFDDLMRPNMGILPMFDMVTLHGVWSWVGPSVQQAILDFLNRHLRPGGLVYLSYNAMPAWSVRTPLQRLLKELAVLWPGRSDHAAENAVAMLHRLADAKVIPVVFHDGLKKMTEGQRFSPSYLSHEYLNQHWQPVYHADVARALGEAKLVYVGSTELLRNFVNLGLTAEQRKLLDEIPIVELRETLRDYFFDYSFRHDVYVRGARRMTEARRDATLGALRLTLVRPIPELIEIASPIQTVWRPNPEAYGPFLGALQRRPHGVTELLSLPDLAPGHAVTSAELVGVLVGSRIAAVFTEPAPDALAVCERFNQLVEADSDRLHGTYTLAVASLRGGMSMTPGDFALYLALKRGENVDPHELAKRFVKRCKEEGGLPSKDGKPLENETEAHIAVARDYSSKLEAVVPIWRLIGLIS
jgi:SAM-dependent methyltransferase